MSVNREENIMVMICYHLTKLMHTRFSLGHVGGFVVYMQILLGGHPSDVLFIARVSGWSRIAEGSQCSS
jgi:hypothetical protein